MAKTKALKNKWKFALGTTSRVPGTVAGITSAHYLILDIDGSLPMDLPDILFKASACTQVIIQKTPRGFHVYTDIIFYSLREVIRAARLMGADKVWTDIGLSRGYLFLADKGPVFMSWPVERMMLSDARK